MLNRVDRANQIVRLSAAAALVMPMAGAAQAGNLEGDALRALVAGKTVYLAVPLGGEFALTYRRDGQVEGQSPDSMLAGLSPRQDRGSWWVSGQNLCQTWKAWYAGKRYCFTLAPIKDHVVRWTRDDGFSGEARIP
jgi:hypothetical protein